MKIAIDESPIASSKHVKHRVRGVGYYVKNLKKELVKQFPQDEFFFFTDSKSLPNDISIIHYPYFEPFFLSLPFKKKVKTVITVHDLTPLVFPEFFPSGIKGRIKWEIQKRMLRKIDQIIADSEASKKDIIKYSGIPSEKIDVVYLAASEKFRVYKESSLLTNAKKRYNLPDTFFLYVGDVTWNKNLPRLLRAASKVNIPLVLVGRALTEQVKDTMNPWNQDLVTVQSIVKDDPLFIRLGFVSDEDLPLLYNLATVFVMPSLYEGFGLPLLEAMGCGTPVLTSKEGSIPEVADDAAVYVDAYSIDSIAEGLTNMLSHNNLRKKLSEKGIQRASLFSWKKTAQETYQIYKRV